MSSPDLTDAERQAVAAVLNTPNLSMGSQIEAFEAIFRAYIGCKHAIGVNSGTAGLHLCGISAGLVTQRLGSTRLVRYAGVIIAAFGLYLFCSV